MVVFKIYSMLVMYFFFVLHDFLFNNMCDREKIRAHLVITSHENRVSRKGSIVGHQLSAMSASNHCSTLT